MMNRMLGQKAPSPADRVRDWKRDMRSEERKLDRQIRDIERAEMHTTRSIKDCAKRGQNDSARLLAKELVNSRRTKSRLFSSKAQMHSIMMHMDHNLAVLKVAGTLEKSAEVMTMMNDLVKVPQIRDTMMGLSKEMMKAGLVEEMMDDTLSPEDEELDSEADAEVNKVLEEILMGARNVPVPEKEAPEEEEQEGTESLEDMQKRLQALKAE